MSKPHTECNEVKRKAHKHAELIKAWADGAEIEFYSDCNERWMPCSVGPLWADNYEYRIKPTPKPDVVIIQSHAVTSIGREEDQKVKWTIDGETGKIKAVELLDK